MFILKALEACLVLNMLVCNREEILKYYDLDYNTTAAKKFVRRDRHKQKAPRRKYRFEAEANNLKGVVHKLVELQKFNTHVDTNFKFLKVSLFYYQRFKFISLFLGSNQKGNCSDDNRAGDLRDRYFLSSDVLLQKVLPSKYEESESKTG